MEKAMMRVLWFAITALAAVVALTIFSPRYLHIIYESIVQIRIGECSWLRL
jgi:hypothetical protein